MPINSNPWYVIDRLDTVMFGHGGQSKDSKEVQRLLFSTSAKWAHTGCLTPADIYNNFEISIQISSIDCAENNLFNAAYDGEIPPVTYFVLSVYTTSKRSTGPPGRYCTSAWPQQIVLNFGHRKKHLNWMLRCKEKARSARSYKIDTQAYRTVG